MGWSALFADGCFSCLCASKNNSSPTANPVEPAAASETETTEEAADVVVPELTLRELNQATDSFSAARLIGDGNRYGTKVYAATLPSGTAAAAKRLGTLQPYGRGTTWSPARDALLRQQVSLLSALRHDNLVRLLGYAITADHRVLLFEFAELGTLHDALHGTKVTAGPRTGSSSSRRAASAPVRLRLRLSWEQRTRIALDAARGLEYLHEAAAVSSHGEISSSKVMLFQGLRAKIADYDLFKRPPLDNMFTMGVPYTMETGSYMPPEYVTGHLIFSKVDIYGFGVVLLELLSGRKPWDDAARDPHALVNWATPLIREGRVKRCVDPKLGMQYPPDGALELGRIALQCLHQDPRSRPSMGAVARMISGIVQD